MIFIPSGVYVRTEKYKRTLSESLKGHKISEETKRKISKTNKGHLVSRVSRKKMSESHKGLIPWNKGEKYPQVSGSNNGNWKGGVVLLTPKIKNSFEYRQWRSDVFTRDSFACQYCGNNCSGNLNAHHIKHFSMIFEEHNITTIEEALNCEELWNINNGITYCKECHKKIHKKIIKSGDAQYVSHNC